MLATQELLELGRLEKVKTKKWASFQLTRQKYLKPIANDADLLAKLRLLPTKLDNKKP